MPEYPRPALFAGDRFDAFHGGDDPAAASRTAHDTAQALLARVRENPSPEVVERLLRFTSDYGIDAVAELWAATAAHSLPGALWRLYLLHTMIGQDPRGVAYSYQRGVESSATIDPVVAGASEPTGPNEIAALADSILRGAFAGDFAVALERAAAFSRLTATGCTELADSAEAASPGRASELTRRALRLSDIAAELVACAELWRSGELD